MTVVVLPSVPPPEAIATVTVAELAVRSPLASRISTTGCVVNGAPMDAPPGCVVMLSSASGPTRPVALKVTGLPARPATVAVTLLGPATVPSVQLVSVAKPVAFVLTVVGVIEPPPPGHRECHRDAWHAVACRVQTLGAADTTLPAMALCVITELAGIVVGAPATAVAVNVIGLPVRPVAPAVSALAPATAPSVQLVMVATPEAFVATTAGLAGDVVPPPVVTVNVTFTPRPPDCRQYR